MSARQCPNCFAFVPPGAIVAYSYDLICPTCQSPLEISALSRNLAAFTGLVAGGIVWWLANAHYSQQPGALGCNTVIRADGSVETLPSTAVTEMQAGDVFVIETPGGGGFGAC